MGAGTALRAWGYLRDSRLPEEVQLLWSDSQVSSPSSEHRGTKKPSAFYLQQAFRSQEGGAGRDRQKRRRPGFVWECQALGEPMAPCQFVKEHAFAFYRVSLETPLEGVCPRSRGL